MVFHHVNWTVTKTERLFDEVTVENPVLGMEILCTLGYQYMA